MLTKRYGFLVRTQTGAGPISLRRGLWCLQRCGYQVCTQNQLEAQRSGFELERRSKGEKRSFKAAPKGTALKRSGAVSLRRGARAHFRTCGSGSGKAVSPKHWHDQLLQYSFSTHHKTNLSLETLFFCVFGEYLTRVPGDPLLTLSSD